jgi:hypothetical protein
MKNERLNRHERTFVAVGEQHFSTHAVKPESHCQPIGHRLATVIVKTILPNGGCGVMQFAVAVERGKLDAKSKQEASP